MSEVLDYSSGWPRPAVSKAKGYVGAVRYVGTSGRGKNLTRMEADAYRTAGLPLAFVYETTAGWAKGGVEVGRGAARAALSNLSACGYRTAEIRCVYAACDVDLVTPADLDAVARTLDGWTDVLGFDVAGTYGEYDVIERFVGVHCRWGWQTRAWSGGKISAKAHLLQQIGGVSVDGVECDRNTVLKPDWGQTPGPNPGGLTMADADSLEAQINALSTKLDAVNRLLSVGDAANNAGTETHTNSLETVRNKVEALANDVAAVSTKLDALSVAAGNPGAIADALADLIARVRVSVAEVSTGTNP